MISVKVDGRDFPFDAAAVRTMGELIEFVKASIDPDVMITSLALNEKNLSDTDWRIPLGVHGSSVLTITTGSKESYLRERFISAPAILDQISASFAQVAPALRSSDTAGANRILGKAVQDLRAFIDWFNTLVSMAEGKQAQLEQYRGAVQKLTEVCEQLLQQQLYRAWGAAAETIESRLIAQLGELKQSSMLFQEPM